MNRNLVLYLTILGVSNQGRSNLFKSPFSNQNTFENHKDSMNAEGIPPNQIAQISSLLSSNVKFLKIKSVFLWLEIPKFGLIFYFL